MRLLHFLIGLPIAALILMGAWAWAIHPWGTDPAGKDR